MGDKVSIIMPAYNCEKFIKKAVGSVQKQTYTDWELLIVNDCSSDGTVDIINSMSADDSRIKLFHNSKRSGAAATRNKAVKNATGKYIAFLDSDDVWTSDKLEKQIGFMEKNGYCFTCTSYDKIDENDNKSGVVIPAVSVDYEGLLRRCPGNSTVIYNAEKLGKFSVPLIKKRNDYLMWMQVIKKAKKIHGLNEVLSSHRIVSNSISSKKMTLVKYHWIVYRKYEKLSVIKSAYLCLFWIAKGIFKIK